MIIGMSMISECLTLVTNNTSQSDLRDIIKRNPFVFPHSTASRLMEFNLVSIFIFQYPL